MAPYTLRPKSGDFTTVRSQRDNRSRNYRFPQGWDLVFTQPVFVGIRLLIPINFCSSAESVMLASHVNDLNQLRERAAEMRASSKELKDNNTAAVIVRLAELYDRLAERAEIRSSGVVPPGPLA